MKPMIGSGRFGAGPKMLAMAALLFACGSAGAAEEMDKGKFKEGCESGGHSFVDNPDGSFQCNLKSGGTIKCTDTKSPCNYTAKMADKLIFGAMKAGHVKMTPSSKRSNDKADGPPPKETSEKAASKGVAPKK